MANNAKKVGSCSQKRGASPFWLCTALLLTGCASQGPLRPPSLHLPAPVRELHAERTGNVVTLRWLNPSRTSDGLSLSTKHGPATLTVEICRAAAPSSPCLATARVTQTSGQAGDFHDSLPAALADGDARLLVYRVRALNAAGKGMQAARVDALAGAAPLSLQDLTAMPVSSGVALRWLPEAAAAGNRVELQVVRGSKATQTSAPGATNPKAVTLMVEPTMADPGGAVDTGAQLGVAQSYSAQRLRTVHLQSGQTMTMSSTPTLVTVRANARPRPLEPPAGLEAVVNTLGALQVALVWEPVDGAASYQVFRAVGSGLPVRLDTAPVDGFSYTDSDVQHGGHYQYSVAAVDRSGQVGPRSVPVSVAIPSE